MKFPDASLAPFFDEIVTVEGSRPESSPSGSRPESSPSEAKTFRAVCRACVMPLSDAMPMLDTSVQTTRAHFSVLVASSGDRAWIEAALGTRPQIGDRITLPSGLVTSVVKTSPLVSSYYELEVEQI